MDKVRIFGRWEAMGPMKEALEAEGLPTSFSHMPTEADYAALEAAEERRQRRREKVIARRARARKP